MFFSTLRVATGCVLLALASSAANADRVIGGYQADGDVLIKPQQSKLRSASQSGSVLNGDSVNVSSDGNANIVFDDRDGFVTIGPDTRATLTSEPGYLVQATGDRIDFGFRYGEPFAVQMDCYVVRPHPLQVVSNFELISGSIIRDKDGIYVLGRNGRLDVTVEGTYVAHDYSGSELKRFDSVARPDRLHIIDKHDRLRGCGRGGSVAAIPQSCPAGAGG